MLFVGFADAEPNATVSGSGHDLFNGLVLSTYAPGEQALLGSKPCGSTVVLWMLTN